ncbi:MAG: hypothetical protein LBL73_04375 [Synergistaceae bacterium]|nr:hypothetical protein [Synergistaceae bacterium]
MAVGNFELTKTGVGTLVVNGNGTTDIVTNGTGGIAIAQGELALAAVDVLADEVYIDVAAGAQFTLRRDVTDAIAALTGDEAGTVELAEGAVLTVDDDTDYPGLITGSGGLTIADDAAATISGVRNNYRGDTTVGLGATLTINHANNLGGTLTGRLFLMPDVGGAGTEGATLRIATGANFLLPNIVILGTDAETDDGRVNIDVPDLTSFEITGNIDYNSNYIRKTSGGNLILSNIGRGSIGNGTFNTGAGAITTALQIDNGRVRIDNDVATAHGDIIVGAGGLNTTPILSVRNSIVLNSAIRFSNLTTFETEITANNFGGGGVVTPAVDVRGLVRTQTPATDLVFNRINFLSLPAGGVNIHDTVQLLRGSPINDYSAQNVFPLEQDGQTKAPFDPFISNNFLYFEATHNIDVPVFGTPTGLAVAPGDPYRIVIPVTTTTNLRAGTLSLAGLTADADPVLDAANNIVITGTAPELDEGEEQRVLRFNVGITSGSLGDTLGYSNTEDFTLTVRAGDVPPTPAENEHNFYASVTATSADISGTVTVRPVPGTSDQVIPSQAFALSLKLAEAPADAEAIYTGTYTSDANGTAAFSITEGAPYTAGAKYVITASGTNLTSRVFEVTIPSVTPTPDRDSGSGGGCDAGFGLFGLFAATGAVTLLRRKG